MRLTIVTIVVMIHSVPSCCRVTLNKQNFCKFTLSNGNFEEFRKNISKFGHCTKLHKNSHFILKLQNYSLPAFPNGSFSNLGFLEQFKLIIADNSSIALLSPELPGYSAFQNLKFKSAVIDISDVSTLSGWQWNALEHLEPENSESFELNIVRSKLVYLHNDFKILAKNRLTAIRILKCQLRWLGEKVFATFHDVKTLELRDNVIERIDRSHLPTEAPGMKTLDLGNNRLTDLPSNLFNGLHINKILLDGNKLKVLQQQVNEILNLNPVPNVSGVLWPCNCGNLLRLLRTGKISTAEQCYMENITIDIAAYKKLCY